MTTVASKNQSALTLIEIRQAELGFTNEQLATQLGFDQPRTIASIKEGKLKIPFNKVQILAKALAIDPAHLLRLVLIETMPDVLIAFESISTKYMLSANEIKLIESYRHLSKNQDVSPTIVDGNAIIALIVA